MGVVTLGFETCDLGTPTGQLTDGLDGCCGWGDVFVVAHHGDGPGVLVETTCVGATDCTVHATGATLVDGAILVHQGVVPDVTPTQGIGMVVVVATHAGGTFSRGVVIATSGVVDGDRGDTTIDSCIALVGAHTPAGAGDHPWHAVGVCDQFHATDTCLCVAVDEDSLQIAGDLSHRLDITIVGRQRGKTILGSRCFGGCFSRSFSGGLRCRRLDWCLCRNRFGCGNSVSGVIVGHSSGILTEEVDVERGHLDPVG